VGLSDQSKESHQAFERSIVLSPKVRECHNITGPFEDLLRVEVEYLAAYTVFHTDVLRTLPQERAITTCVVTDSAKDQRA
jgi:DNA-binding Lrp family transcriptional regulator